MKQHSYVPLLTPGPHGKPMGRCVHCYLFRSWSPGWRRTIYRAQGAGWVSGIRWCRGADEPSLRRVEAIGR